MPLLQPIAALALAPVLEQPRLKLLVVMILTPGVMNAVQFWLVDNIFVHVKKGSGAEQSGYNTAPQESDPEHGVQGECWTERANGAAVGASLLLSKPAVAVKVGR